MRVCVCCLPFILDASLHLGASTGVTQEEGAPPPIGQPSRIPSNQSWGLCWVSSGRLSISAAGRVCPSLLLLRCLIALLVSLMAMIE